MKGNTKAMNRGRPGMVMTHRRKQVFEQLADRAANGERVSLAELARRCGLTDYRNARRIVADLRRMGKLQG